MWGRKGGVRCHTWIPMGTLSSACLKIHSWFPGSGNSNFKHIWLLWNPNTHIHTQIQLLPKCLTWKEKLLYRKWPSFVNVDVLNESPLPSPPAPPPLPPPPPIKERKISPLTYWWKERVHYADFQVIATYPMDVIYCNQGLIKGQGDICILPSPNTYQILYSLF